MTIVVNHDHLVKFTQYDHFNTTLWDGNVECGTNACRSTSQQFKTTTVVQCGSERDHKEGPPAFELIERNVKRVLGVCHPQGLIEVHKGTHVEIVIKI